MSIPDRAAELALLERVDGTCRATAACSRRIARWERSRRSPATRGSWRAWGRTSVRPSSGWRWGVLRAQAFFDDPSAGLDYLRERGVAAIVVARRSPAFALGGYRVARVPPDRFDGIPFLRRWFENDAGVVYRVGCGARRVPSRVDGRPGFDCDGDPTPGG